MNQTSINIPQVSLVSKKKIDSYQKLGNESKEVSEKLKIKEIRDKIKNSKLKKIQGIRKALKMKVKQSLNNKKY